MKRRLSQAPLLCCFALVIALTACKKDKKAVPDPVVPVTPGGTVGTRADLTRDSIFLYAKQVYLWNEDLPSYESFNPRKYTTLATDLLNFQSELFDISQIKINPATGKAYEYRPGAPTFPKYSHIDEAGASGAVIVSSPATVNSISSEGVGNDFGFEYSFAGASQTSYNIYFLYVNSGSPAYKAGFSRGDVIRKINGQAPAGNNTTADFQTLENAFKQSSVSLECRKKNGEVVTTTLTKSTYTTNPVFKDSVYTAGSSKIGYLAYSQFTSDANSAPALRKTFARFLSAGITDLVVDLRYNGGGYGTTAELLCNLIAPLSANDKVMYSQYFNALMQSGKATFLEKQPYKDQSGKQIVQNGKKLFYSDRDYSVAANTIKFSKEGGNNAIKKVVFIVSGNTASASELVINNLKPYMDVKLVGSTTYGKPIGFFPILIDKYEVYYSMIAPKNASGQGDYFAGFSPDSQVSDYIDIDFGNTLDPNLKAAISYIVNGNFTSAVTVSSSRMPVIFDRPDTERNNFRGLIEDRFPVKQ